MIFYLVHSECNFFGLSLTMGILSVRGSNGDGGGVIVVMALVPKNFVKEFLKSLICYWLTTYFID